MSAAEMPTPRGGGMLSGLLAPLRLPERVLEALDSLTDSARELAPMRSELTRVREQTEPLGELLPALERLEQSLIARVDSLREVVSSLESEESYLNKRIEQVLDEMSAMHKTISGLQDDVERITDRLPDPGEKRGPLETARDVLSGGGD